MLFIHFPFSVPLAFYKLRTCFLLSKWLFDWIQFLTWIWGYPKSEFFDEKKSPLKDSKHIWVDAVFDADSEYVKKLIDFYDNFQKSSVIFQRSSEKPIFGFFLRKNFAYENSLLGLGYQMLKTAGLYHVPIESCSKNIRVHWLLAPIIDRCRFYMSRVVL